MLMNVMKCIEMQRPLEQETVVEGHQGKKQELASKESEVEMGSVLARERADTEGQFSPTQSISRW
jgi:hypothetical protein